MTKFEDPIPARRKAYAARSQALADLAAADPADWELVEEALEAIVDASRDLGDLDAAIEYQRRLVKLTLENASPYDAGVDLQVLGDLYCRKTSGDDEGPTPPEDRALLKKADEIYAAAQAQYEKAGAEGAVDVVEILKERMVIALEDRTRMLTHARSLLEAAARVTGGRRVKAKVAEHLQTAAWCCESKGLAQPVAALTALAATLADHSAPRRRK